MILAVGIYVPTAMVQQFENTLDNRATDISVLDRQQQVLSMIMQGHTNKVIAVELNVVEATVTMQGSR
ncbi:MAG: LuxR C-terminal-related transcriptional regulator [Gammaproteobacteria bacterium]|nr:LuxR C-terminal-related transcriptional regulator [Gammaproteobacteria bacterium]